MSSWIMSTVTGSVPEAVNTRAASDECDRKDRVDQTLEQIAQTKLDVPTLRERKSDGLDFHEVSVWGLKRALAAAYEAGREDAK